MYRVILTRTVGDPVKPSFGVLYFVLWECTHVWDMKGLEGSHCGEPCGVQSNHDGDESSPAHYQADHESVWLKFSYSVRGVHNISENTHTTTERTSPPPVLAN